MKPLFYEPQDNHYGEKIKLFRKVRKVSQLELESNASLAFGTISRIENGKINPTKETLFKIASVLKLEKDDVIEMFGI